MEAELATLLKQCFPARAKSVKKLMAEFVLADHNGDGLVSVRELSLIHI